MDSSNSSFSVTPTKSISNNIRPSNALACSTPISSTLQRPLNEGVSLSIIVEEDELSKSVGFNDSGNTTIVEIENAYDNHNDAKVGKSEENRMPDENLTDFERRAINIGMNETVNPSQSVVVIESSVADDESVTSEIRTVSSLGESIDAENVNVSLDEDGCDTTIVAEVNRSKEVPVLFKCETIVNLNRRSSGNVCENKLNPLKDSIDCIGTEVTGVRTNIKVESVDNPDNKILNNNTRLKNNNNPSSNEAVTSSKGVGNSNDCDLKPCEDKYVVPKSSSENHNLSSNSNLITINVYCNTPEMNNNLVACENTCESSTNACGNSCPVNLGVREREGVNFNLGDVRGENSTGRERGNTPNADCPVDEPSDMSCDVISLSASTLSLESTTDEAFANKPSASQKPNAKVVMDMNRNVQQPTQTIPEKNSSQCVQDDGNFILNHENAGNSLANVGEFPRHFSQVSNNLGNTVGVVKALPNSTAIAGPSKQLVQSEGGNRVGGGNPISSKFKEMNKFNSDSDGRNPATFKGRKENEMKMHEISSAELDVTVTEEDVFYSKQDEISISFDTRTDRNMRLNKSAVKDSAIPSTVLQATGGSDQHITDKALKVHHLLINDVKLPSPKRPCVEATSPPRARPLEEFVSTNVLENADNYDPKWQVYRQLVNNQLRYECVRKKWLNPQVPNVKTNLSTYNWRARNGLDPIKPPANAVQAYFKEGNIHNVFSKAHEDANNLFDEKIKVLERIRDDRFREADEKLHYSLYRSAPMWHENHYNNFRQEKESIRAEFALAYEELLAGLQKRLAAISDAEKEMTTVYNFYTGLSEAKSPTNLTPWQVACWYDREDTLNNYEFFYSDKH